MIVNPSPISPEFLQADLACDTLIANEHEAVVLTGMKLSDFEAKPENALGVARCRQLIITCGGKPTLAIAAGQTYRVAPPKVTPVDTVGAGDAFAGAFAVAQAGGFSLEEAVRFANAAGALATQKIGAQSSIPMREEIVSSMREQ